ncbi:Swi5-domain-containing protein [Rozella allomycis CSF55]|nr:Swi5-domain-containing protein [Rozella allomycis CSF55]
MIIYVKIPSSERIKLSLQMKIDSLQQEVDEKMDELEIIDIENEYKDYLNLVHTYNDLKDAGQKIIGILAVNKGVTSRELYKDFDLNIDD